MNELIISYGISKGQKILSMIIGGYFSLYAFYQAISIVLTDNIGFNFYLALIAIVLGIILLLNVTLWVTKPILVLNQNSLYVRCTSQKSIYQSDWINIREVAIGISYLKISETDGKDYNVNLSDLKYSDLKQVKTFIIEYCESKNIPYKND